MDKLNILLNEVFDENGNIRPCGREACQELISEASITYPGIDFGNAKTGIMNIENMLKLRSDIF